MEENNNVIQAINNRDWLSVYGMIQGLSDADRNANSNLLMQILDQDYQQPEQKKIASRAAVSLLNKTNIDVDVRNNDHKSLLELAVEKNYPENVVNGILIAGNKYLDDVVGRGDGGIRSMTTVHINKDQPLLWSDDIMCNSFRTAIEQSNLENAQLLLKYGAYIPNDRMSDTMNFIQNKIDNTQNEEEKEKWTNMKQDTLGFCFLHLLKENNPEHIDNFLNTYSRMPINTDVQDYLGNTISNTIEYINNPHIVDLLYERDNRLYNSMNGNNSIEQARNINIVVTNFLLKHDLIKYGMGDYNPATYAVVLGDKWTINKLHEVGYDLNQTDKLGYTTMTTAVACGDEEMVEFIYQKEPVSLIIPGGNGYNPVTTAVACGDEEMVEFIYQKEPVSLTIPDGNGYTPMTTAVARGDEEMVEFIYQKEPVSLIIPGGNGYNPVTTAVKEGNADMVNLIYQKKPISLIIPDRNGYNPMTTAVKEGKADMVDLIYQKEPVLSISLSDDNGYNPMTTAVKEGNADMVNLIYQKKPSNIRMPDKNGYTPLGIALKTGNVDMVRLLCEKGVDPTIFSNGRDHDITTVDFVQEKIYNTQGVERIKWQNMLGVLEEARGRYEANRGNHRAGGLNALEDVNREHQVQGNRVVENPENPRGNENEANHRAGGLNALENVNREHRAQENQGGANQRHDGNGLGVLGRDRGAQQPLAVQGARNQGNQRGNGNGIGG